MSRIDKAALLLSFIAVIAAWFVSSRVFENIPHLEDEIAYVWQAELIAKGELTIPTPVEPRKFLIPFVIDYEGQRFGKYPLGWPALLAIGVWLGLRDWVNPLLAGLAVWLMYRLGKRLAGERVGILAALLTVTSPFFLLNTGSLLSHAWGLVLSLAFVLGWWGLVEEPDANDSKTRWLAAGTAGATLGMLAVTRPFSAIGVALPFGVHGMYLLLKGSPGVRRRVLLVGGLIVLLSLLVPFWQFAVTGDPLLNPYTLWWDYDKVGFGTGVGPLDTGHTLSQGWINTRHSLVVAYSDVFGWPMLSWIFLPFGLWASRRNGKMLLTGSVFASLLVLYLAYWIGAWLFGPRYQFEGLYSLTLLTAAGIEWLGGWELRAKQPANREEKARRLAVFGLVALLFAGNLSVYLPARLSSMVGLYGISSARMDPFLTPEAEALAPAVIIVHTSHWTDYGTLLDMQDPFLTSPFIFSFGDKSTFPDILRETYPERGIYHYYPDSEPYKFFSDRVPELKP